MKSWSLIGLALWAMSVAAYGQQDGTVAFQNLTPAVAGRVYVGTNLAPAGYTVELMYRPVGSGGPLSHAVTFTNTFFNNGQFFDSFTVNLSGIPAGAGSVDPIMNVELQIRGWLGIYATFSDALAAGAGTGQTAIFANPTGNGGSPPSVPANLVGWLANNPLVIVPEPSSLSLMGLAGGVVWLVRRKGARAWCKKPKRCR